METPSKHFVLKNEYPGFTSYECIDDDDLELIITSGIFYFINYYPRQVETSAKETFVSWEKLDEYFEGWFFGIFGYFP